jgi:hypothetical protein
MIQNNYIDRFLFAAMQRAKLKNNYSIETTDRNQIACLRYIIIPLLIILGSHMLFNLVAYDLVTLKMQLSKFITAELTSAIHVLQNKSSAMVKWGAIVLFYLFISITTLTLCLRNMKRSLTPFCFLSFLMLSLFISGIWLAYLVNSFNQQETISMIFKLTFDTLTISRQYTEVELASISAILDLINILSVLTPVFIIVACCCTVIPCRNINIESAQRCAQQMRNLKELLNLGSVMLAIGVLHLHAWLNLSATLSTTDILIAAINDMSLSISIYWGVSFTVLIAAVYIPMSLNIKANAQSALMSKHQDIDKTRKWLEEHDLLFSTAKQLPQILAVFAPLMAGSFGSTLLGISSF